MEDDKRSPDQMAVESKAFLDAPDDEWVCDSILSHHLNAAMVCGPLSATTAWRAELGLTPAP